MKSSRRIFWLLSGGIILLLLTCLGITDAPVMVLFMLVVGWIGYLMRVVPRVQVNTAGVFTGITCIAVLILLGHMMARWLWREMRKESPLPWRLRWTLSIIAIVVLMFVAGIGAVGATHQTVWLARSDKPMFEYRSREAANRIKCASSMRQIGQALLIYAQAHNNHLPDTLAILLTSADLVSEVFVCPSSNDEKAAGATPQEQAAHLGDRTLSYVYYGRGRTLPLPANLPILSEPLLNHDGDGMNVLFADGTVQWLTPGEAQEVLRPAAR